ncbi:hypothetical protein GCM10022393_08450 [Aquimarina addita]|uniref:Transporter n=1 Tax=Aquimarina addita TaxID=870485 RepID=A0ABP7XCB4_9FLAO
MLHTKKSSLLTALLLCPLLTIFGQVPVDGFYAKKNTLTVATGYHYKNYDQFYMGSTLSEGNPAGLGEISSSIVSLYAKYAILDGLSATVTLPYISVKSDDGVLDPVQQVDQVDGLQDLGLFIKARILEKNYENTSGVTLGGALGITLPIGDYEGAGVLSLGNQATTYNGTAIFHYTTSFKIFTELQAGYSIRNSSDFDIPNAVLYSAKIGYLHKNFYFHTAVDVQNSASGLDIGTPEFTEAGAATILPETDVDFTNLSFTLYAPVYKNNFGVSLTYGFTIDGRNYSKESGIGIGLVYNSN